MHCPLLDLSLWQRIDQVDKWLFIKLNSGFTNPVFDTVLPFFRDSIFWAPFYLFIVAFIGLNFGKKGFYWGIGFLCTVALTDLIGTYIFKQSFQRLRPCQDPFFFTEVRLLLKQCSGSYSFVSNHAANHFGLATFMVLTFRHMFKGWIFVLYLWAVMIAYAQVYVGVHYPLDVICGGMLGAGIGWLTAWFYHHNFGFISLEH